MKFQDLSDRNQLALAEIITGLPKGSHMLYAKYGEAWGDNDKRPTRPYYEIKINKKDTTFSAKIREVVELQEALGMNQALALDFSEELDAVEKQGPLTFKQFIVDMNGFVKEMAEQTKGIADFNITNTKEERLDKDEGGNGGMYLTEYDHEVEPLSEAFDLEISEQDIKEYFDTEEAEQAIKYLEVSPKNAEYQISVDDKAKYSSERGGSYEDLDVSYTADWWYDKDQKKIFIKAEG